jgi:hypothetical protein
MPKVSYAEIKAKALARLMKRLAKRRKAVVPKGDRWVKTKIKIGSEKAVL